MKLIVATIYSLYTTDIVDEGNMAQSEKFLAPPGGDKLVLRFTPVR